MSVKLKEIKKELRSRCMMPLPSKADGSGKSSPASFNYHADQQQASVVTQRQRYRTLERQIESEKSHAF
jgi:hypothetical protein